MEAYLHIVQARDVLEDTEFYTNLGHAGFVCRAHLVTDPALQGWQVSWSGDMGRGAPEVGHVYADIIFPTRGSGLLVWMWPAYLFRYYFDLQVAGEKGSRELLLYAPHAGPAELATIEEYIGEKVKSSTWPRCWRNISAARLPGKLPLGGMPIPRPLPGPSWKFTTTCALIMKKGTGWLTKSAFYWPIWWKRACFSSVNISSYLRCGLPGSTPGPWTELLPAGHQSDRSAYGPDSKFPFRRGYFWRGAGS